MDDIRELVRNAIRSVSEKTRENAYQLLVEGGMSPEEAARNANRVADKVKTRSAVTAAPGVLGGEVIGGILDSAMFFDDAIRGRIDPRDPEYTKGAFDLATNVAMPSLSRSVTRGGAANPNTLGIFGTTDAKRAPIETLDAAKKMQKEGADPNDIWRNTGWGFDPTDQKWKFEIDDSAARVNRDRLMEQPREVRRAVSNMSSRNNDRFVSRGRERPAAAPQTTLGDIYEHPELYANYDITGTPIVRSREVQNSAFVRGMYDHANKTMDVNRSLDAEGLRSVLAHEANHNVQGIAGMTRGTSPAAAGSYDAYRYSPGEGGPFGSYNVEKRLNMTADERRRMTPFETADADFSGKLPIGNAPSMSMLPPQPGILDFSGQYSPRSPLLPPGSGYTPVPGKPGVVTIPGVGQVEARPVGILDQAAVNYMTKIGRPGEHQARSFPEFDEAKATRIANAFEAMPHNPADPAVKRSYDALIDETLSQYNALRDAGVDIRFLKEGMSDPYAKSPAMGYADLVKNNRLYVFPTDFGFGSSATFNPVDNPLLKGVGRIGDKPNAVANDAFRAVHDLFGHFAPGNPFFRHKGEDRAWNVHARMFSPEARGAMTTETRGQNSWLNFGPYGEFNKTASGADTRYADQKIGLLPEWVWRDEEFR